MRGLITTRHLILNAAIIIEEFGWLAYGKCLVQALFSRKPVTFLGCICRLRH